MKSALIIGAAALLAGCDVKVRTPEGGEKVIEKNTTVVNPPGEKKVEKNTTIVNPPPKEEKKVENNTTIVNPPAPEKK